MSRGARTCTILLACALVTTARARDRGAVHPTVNSPTPAYVGNTEHNEFASIQMQFIAALGSSAMVYILLQRLPCARQLHINNAAIMMCGAPSQTDTIQYHAMVVATRRHKKIACGLCLVLAVFGSSFMCTFEVSA